MLFGGKQIMFNRNKGAISDLEVEVVQSLQPRTHHGLFGLKKHRKKWKVNYKYIGSSDAKQE